MIIGNNLHVDAFYDEATSTISYLVMDRETRQCALIDSVLDYDPKSGRTCSASADRLIERVTELNAACAGCWKLMYTPTIFQRPPT